MIWWPEILRFVGDHVAGEIQESPIACPNGFVVHVHKRTPPENAKPWARVRRVYVRKTMKQARAVVLEAERREARRGARVIP
jgi:hypothetical protein